MTSKSIQEQCEAFLKKIGVQGFIVFGYLAEDEVKLAWACNDMPIDVAIESLGWTLKSLVQQTLQE